MPNPILITGAAGFIGSRMVEACNGLDIPIISVDHLACFTERKQHQDLQFGQILDIDTLLKNPTLEDLKPRAIVHLGAITDTRATDLSLLNTYNLECSKTLWKYATRTQIPLIYASSAATYGAGEQGYLDSEEHIPSLKPLNLYGQSKQDFDLWALSQRQTPPQWAGLKFFNVYGFGENHKKFMSSVVLHAYEQILKTGTVTLFKSHRDGIADGQQKRDFVYVADVVAVIQFLLSSSVKRGIFNLGSGKARSFLDLARATFHALGCEEQIQFIDTPIGIRDQYQYFTEAPMQKLRDAGFTEPFTSLEAGVRSYVERLLDP